MTIKPLPGSEGALPENRLTLTDAVTSDAIVHEGFWKKFQLQLTILGAGVGLLILEKGIPLVFGHTDTPKLHFALEVIHELGMAAIVAAVVSLIYDIRYHHSNFSKHVERAVALTKELSREVKTTEHRLEKATKGIEEKMGQVEQAVKSSENKLKDATSEMERQLDEVKGSVKQFNQVIRFASAERVEGMYHRVSSGDSTTYDEDLRKRMVYAIEHANKFIYLMGRAFDDSIFAKETPLWLWEPIEKRLAQRVDKLSVRVLIGNTLEDNSQLRDEYMHRTSQDNMRGDGSDFLIANRNVIRFLLERFRLHSESHKLAIRLLKCAPPCFMLITEDRLFVEQYLPFRKPGETVVFEVLRGAVKDRKARKDLLTQQDNLIQNPSELLQRVMAERGKVDSDSYMAHIKCYEYLWSNYSCNLAAEIKKWLARRQVVLTGKPDLRAKFEKAYDIANELDPCHDPQMTLLDVRP